MPKSKNRRKSGEIKKSSNKYTNKTVTEGTPVFDMRNELLSFQNHLSNLRISIDTIVAKRDAAVSEISAPDIVAKIGQGEVDLILSSLHTAIGRVDDLKIPCDVLMAEVAVSAASVGDITMPSDTDFSMILDYSGRLETIYNELMHISTEIDRNINHFQDLRGAIVNVPNTVPEASV